MGKRPVRIRGVDREPVDIERLVRVLLLQVRRMQAEQLAPTKAAEPAPDDQASGAAS